MAEKQAKDPSEMTLDEYQRAASRTAVRNKPGFEQLLNYALGLGGETGELLDLIKKQVFHDHPVDPERIASELGDVLWYVSQLARLANMTLSDLAVYNIQKLQTRYPNGFSSEDSQKRVDTVEKKIILPN